MNDHKHQDEQKRQKKKAQPNAQLQALEAAEETLEKKRDTRRKILSGAYY